MSKKVRKHSSVKEKVRLKHRKKIRSKVTGTTERPRLSVFRSNVHVYAQIIDDLKGTTLVSASTVEAENRGKLKGNVEGAREIGLLLGKRALANNIDNVVYDRGGYPYHGQVKALAEGARESGLKF